MPAIRKLAAWTLATNVALAACGGGNSNLPGPTPRISGSANPASLTIEQGATGTVAITLVRSDYTGTVTASVEGLPAGITATFNPPTLSGSATNSTATVTVATSLTPGTYNATIRASGSGVGDATGSYQIVVTARPDFSLSAVPAGLSIPAGLSATSLITVARNGFTGPVAMSADNPPAGITANVTPASATDTSRVALTVARTVTPGDYPVTVTGTAAPGPRTVVIAVTVTPEPNYALSAAPAATEIIQGGQGSVTVTLTRTNFTGPVTLALDNPPTGTTSTMTVSIAGSVAPGRSNLSIKGTAAGVPSLRAGATSSANPGDRATSLGVTVVPATLAVPASVTIAQGAVGSVSVAINRAGSFTGPVTLSLSGRPNLTRVAFAPTTVAGNTSTLTIIPNGTPVGTYPLTISGATGTAGDPTTRIDLIVTGTAGGASTFTFCDPSNFPVWFGYRDGTGPWAQATPTTNGSTQSFSYPINSTTGEIAYVLPVQFAIMGQASARMVENSAGGPRRGLGGQMADMVAQGPRKPFPTFTPPSSSRARGPNSKARASVRRRSAPARPR